jgi:hypothetical protein
VASYLDDCKSCGQHQRILKSSHNACTIGEVNLKAKKRWRLHPQVELSLKVIAAAILSDRNKYTDE